MIGHHLKREPLHWICAHQKQILLATCYKNDSRNRKLEHLNTNIFRLKLLVIWPTALKDYEVMWKRLQLYLTSNLYKAVLLANQQGLGSSPQGDIMDRTQSAKSVSSCHQLYSKKKTWVIWLATWTRCSYIVWIWCKISMNPSFCRGRPERPNASLSIKALHGTI